MRQRTKNEVSLYVGDFGGMNSESLFASDCEPVIPGTFDRSFDTRHCWNIDTGIALSKVSAYVSLSIILFSDFRMTICKLFFTFFSFIYSNLSFFPFFPIKMTVELGLHRFFC